MRSYACSGSGWGAEVDPKVVLRIAILLLRLHWDLTQPADDLVDRCCDREAGELLAAVRLTERETMTRGSENAVKLITHSQMHQARLKPDQSIGQWIHVPRRFTEVARFEETNSTLQETNNITTLENCIDPYSTLRP